MKRSVADVIAALATTGLAALGGALAVFSGYDDAPGGVVIGFLLIMGSLALGLRTRRRA